MSTFEELEEYVLSENRQDLLDKHRDKYGPYYQLLSMESQISSLLKTTEDQHTKDSIQKLLNKVDQILSSLNDQTRDRDISKLHFRHKLRKYFLSAKFKFNEATSSDDDNKDETNDNDIINQIINKLTFKFGHKKQPISLMMN